MEKLLRRFDDYSNLQIKGTKMIKITYLSIKTQQTPQA